MTMRIHTRLTGCTAFALTLALTALLSGCASVVAAYRAYAEPPETGARARVRVIANAWVTATPNSQCADPSAPGTGTVFGGKFGLGSSGFRNRSLGMPAGPSNRSFDTANTAEFYVAASQPLSLRLSYAEQTNVYSRRCQVAATFVPEPDQDYEAIMLMQGATCRATVTSLSQPEQKVAVTYASRCP